MRSFSTERPAQGQPGTATASRLVTQSLRLRCQGWPMSHVEICECHARECLVAAGQSEDLLKREVLLRLALDWMAEAIAALKQPLPRATPAHYH